MTGKKGPISWILDIGTSHHITHHVSVPILQTPIHISISNGTIVKITQCGWGVLNYGIILNRVLYDPTFACNLIFERQLTRDLG